MTSSPRRGGKLYCPSDRLRSPNPASPVWDFLPDTGVPSPPDIEEHIKPLLPPTGYMRQWVEWGHVCSDCPSIYMLGAWLTGISALTDGSLRVVGPGGSRVRPCLFTLLVGPSGESRKTYAIQRVSRLFANEPELYAKLGDSAGSVQGLITGLQERADQIIFDEDMGDMLQAGQKGPVQQLKLFLNKAFDGGRVTHRLKAENYKAENYSLSYLTGINWPLLEQYSEKTDFSGGLFSRFLILDAKLTRKMPGMAARIPDAHLQRANAYFTHALQMHMQHSPSGVIEFDADASDLMVEWEVGFDERYSDVRERDTIAPSFARMVPLAARIAMLYAFDRYISAGVQQDLRISIEDVTYALRLVETHLASVAAVFSKITGTGYGRKRQVVLAAIPDANHDGRWATLGNICRTALMDLREVKGIVETLLASEEIRCGNVGANMGYQKAPPKGVASKITIVPDVPPSAPAPGPAAPTPPPPSAVVSRAAKRSYSEDDVYHIED